MLEEIIFQNGIFNLLLGPLGETRLELLTVNLTLGETCQGCHAVKLIGSNILRVENV